MSTSSQAVAQEAAAHTAHGYAAAAPDAPLAPLSFERRALGPHDVRIEILHCGVCHSDLHMARDEWGGAVYPVVPGHEIVGRISAVGDAVERFAVGEHAGVGCLVDSCRECEACASGLEQYCDGGAVYTYGGVEKETGRPTNGGYSSSIVVDQDFVLRIADDADLAATAPLLCAGITTYSPLRHHGVGPGSRVGVVGLGGLGHMAVKLASALGSEVVLFTTSPDKRAQASELGADRVVVSTDAEALAELAGELDLIVDTVAAPHQLDPYLAALKLDGALVLVGIPPESEQHPSPHAISLIDKRRTLSGSSIGGIAETQEMLDFCAEHGIVAEIEPVAIDQINEAYERMLSGDVRFRFVIDMSTLPG